eukprot:364935-Alexandrium_andersonii.AAC.1
MRCKGESRDTNNPLGTRTHVAQGMGKRGKDGSETCNCTPCKPTRDAQACIMPPRVHDSQ